MTTGSTSHSLDARQSLASLARQIFDALLGHFDPRELIRDTTRERGGCAPGIDGAHAEDGRAKPFAGTFDHVGIIAAQRGFKIALCLFEVDECDHTH
jgi:hypothetical protein